MSEYLAGTLLLYDKDIDSRILENTTDNEDSLIDNLVLIPNNLASNFKRINNLKNMDDIINQINRVVIKTSYFSSKKMNTDEFTNISFYYCNRNNIREVIDNKKMLVSENDVFETKIIGSNTFLNYCCGTIIYHKINKILFNYSCIEFMILNMSIPIQYLNINIKKPVQFTRKSGQINTGYLEDNQSLRISKTLDTIILLVEFNENQNTNDSNNDIKNTTNDKTDNLTDNLTNEQIDKNYENEIPFLNFRKNIKIEEYMRMNNIDNITIIVPDYYEEYVDNLTHNNGLVSFIDNQELKMVNLHYMAQISNLLKYYQTFFDKFANTNIDNNIMTIELKK